MMFYNEKYIAYKRLWHIFTEFYFGEVLNFEMMSYKLPTWIIFAIFLPSFTDLQHV